MALRMSFATRGGTHMDTSLKREPNFIIVFCDDLGYGDLGCYGSTKNKTPRIDRMADEGMRYTDFYVGQPLCSPSRAALMTGCYPKRVGLENGETFAVLLPGDAIGLNPTEVTLPKLLKRKEYSTKIIGKWHLGDQKEFLPDKHGFDSHFGLAYSNDMRLLTADIIRDEELSSAQIERRKKFPPLPLLRDGEVFETEPDQASLSDRYTEEALSYIREHRDTPFFLYMAHMYVHLPLYAPEKFMKQSENGSYGAAVEHLDYCAGRILDELKAQGIEENTLVVFTSDNGSNGRHGGSNYPLKGAKGSTWEGGMREPCIMWWPGMIPEGMECTELCTAMDFLPTFAALADISLPEEPIMDGKDIRGLLFAKDGAHSPYEALFYYAGANLKAVRSGRWKLHIHENLLYDLETDTGESINVYDSHPKVVESLSKLADACVDDLGDEWTGKPGRNCRPAGRVENPTTLTPLVKNHPFTKASYD